jgi:hypothetical protein
MAKEKETTSSILENAVLEYKQIIEVAKKQLAEGHSKELDDMISKLLKETENISLYKEPETVKEESQSTVAVQQESAPAGAEAINMKEASMKEIEEAFDAASDDDEFKVVKTDDTNGNFSLTDIEGEVNEVMSEIEAAENAQQVDVQPEEDNLTKFKKLHEEMGKMIEAMDAEKNDLALKEQFHQKMTEMMGQGYEAKIGVAECGKMFETFKGQAGQASAVNANAGQQSAAAPIQENKEGSNKTFMPKSNVPGTFSPNSVAGGGSFPSTAVPAEKSLTKAVTETEVAADAAPVEETHGVSLSSNKTVGGTNAPQLDSKEYAKNKVRLALQKENDEKLQKRINSLVNENFELTKAANKAKSTLSEMSKLNESYREAIDKYRKQLNEMALVSTNIANVNNILVNESLALSHEDKKSIIGEFEKVKTVEESETTYKKVIKDFSEQKKTIKESVEQKIQGTAIEASSSEEVKAGVENSNALNEHVEKIKKLSTYQSKK